MLSDGQVCSIDKKEVLARVEAEPKLSYHIAQYLARQLKEADEERLELAQGAVRERLARLLALLSRTYGTKYAEGIRINLPLKREEMADMIGSAAETTMRVIKDFKEEKLLAVNGRIITVLDEERLTSIAGLA